MGFPRLFEPRVTDRAVLAWMEHVHGLDAAAVRREILDEGRGDWISQGPLLVHVPRLRITLVSEAGVVITVHTHDVPGRTVPEGMR